MLRVLSISLLLFAAGCVTEQRVITYGTCFNKSLQSLLDTTDLKQLFQGISTEFCPANCREGSQGNLRSADCREENHGPTLLVTDFVDLQTLVPNDSGLLMGEVMRTSLNNVCNYDVLQGEFARYFTLSDLGLMVLTRRASEIKNNAFEERDAIVGTYSYLNNNKVMIFVRRINTRTGKVARMVSRELDYSCAGRLATYRVH
jgi:hypothetical protein